MKISTRLTDNFFLPFQNSIKNGVYPASVESFWVTVGLLMGLHFLGINVPGGLLVRILPLMPEYVGIIRTIIFYCCRFSCINCIVFSFLQ